MRQPEAPAAAAVDASTQHVLGCSARRIRLCDCPETQQCVARCRWAGEQVKGADAEPTVKLSELLSRMDGSEPFDSMIYQKELQPSAWKSMAEYFEV